MHNKIIDDSVTHAYLEVCVILHFTILHVTLPLYFECTTAPRYIELESRMYIFMMNKTKCNTGRLLKQFSSCVKLKYPEFYLNCFPDSSRGISLPTYEMGGVFEFLLCFVCTLFET